MYYYRCLVVVLTVLLSACVTTQTTSPVDSSKQVDVKQAIEDAWLQQPAYFAPNLDWFENLASWSLSAKVAVVTSQVREQANLVWKYQSNQNQYQHQLRLFGPLGAGQVKLRYGQNTILLSDAKGRQYKNQDALHVLKQSTQLDVPLNALPYWLFALPYSDVASAEYVYQLQEQQLSVLKQMGWTIRFSKYKAFDGKILPHKIIAIRGEKEGEKESPEYTKITIVIKKRNIIKH